MIDWRRLRELYGYPTVGLAGSADALQHRCFSSTTELDQYHQELLRADNPANVKLGYLSAIYWGHYASSDGRTLAPRALSRAKAAAAAQSTEVQQQMLAAVDLLRAHRCGEAAKKLTSLPQIGFAFATKLCAFLEPEICGVADSTIAERCSSLRFATRNGYLTDTRENIRSYDRFCRLLRRQAAALNRRQLVWTDRDGRHHSWRALDVERALFAVY